MKKFKTYSSIIIGFLSIIIFSNSCLLQTDEKLKYLGQTPPALIPEMFAPDYISKKDRSEFGSVFNKEATEFYYGVDVNGKSEIWFTRLEGKTWSKPKVLLSYDKYSCNDPFLSSDGNKLYFISNKVVMGSGTKEDYDICYIARDGNKWNPKLINAGPNINTDKNEYYMSFTKDGSMYFSSNRNTTEKDRYDFNIYKSKLVEDAFQKPKLLGNSINTTAYEADVFVSPDESYIIFCSIKKSGYGKGDLYISFKNGSGKWSIAKNMGKLINTKNHELCPYVTKDGKYLFYTSNQDIYWVGADIINSLKEQYK